MLATSYYVINLKVVSYYLQYCMMHMDIPQYYSNYVHYSCVTYYSKTHTGILGSSLAGFMSLHDVCSCSDFKLPNEKLLKKQLNNNSNNEALSNLLPQNK